jgi:hypothetical protein
MRFSNRAGAQLRPVDWSEWRHAHEVKVWQGVALSMGIEPTLVRFHRDAWMAGPGRVIPNEDPEFDKRIRMVSRALLHELEPASMVMGEPARCGVFVAQFAAWVRDVVRWDAPPELLALAGTKAVESSQPIPGSNEPAPLTSGDMAALLDGIEGRDEAGWQRMLADPPKWLDGARVARGSPGRAPAAWNPVALALALQSRRAPDAKLNAIFAHGLAARWADEWARANQAADDYGI